MKNSLSSSKISRKSVKDANVIELKKGNVFNACIGRPLNEVNYWVEIIEVVNVLAEWTWKSSHDEGLIEILVKILAKERKLQHVW